jgi:hypothetical protein
MVHVTSVLARNDPGYRDTLKLLALAFCACQLGPCRLAACVSSPTCIDGIRYTDRGFQLRTKGNDGRYQ